MHPRTHIGVMQSDLARYLVVGILGGYYLDTDISCAMSIEQSLAVQARISLLGAGVPSPLHRDRSLHRNQAPLPPPPASFGVIWLTMPKINQFVGTSWTRNTTWPANFAFASVAGHPFWTLVLDEMAHLPDISSKSTRMHRLGKPSSFGSLLEPSGAFGKLSVIASTPCARMRPSATDTQQSTSDGSRRRNPGHGCIGLDHHDVLFTTGTGLLMRAIERLRAAQRDAMHLIRLDERVLPTRPNHALSEYTWRPIHEPQQGSTKLSQTWGRRGASFESRNAFDLSHAVCVHHRVGLWVETPDLHTRREQNIALAVGMELAGIGTSATITRALHANKTRMFRTLAWICRAGSASPVCGRLGKFEATQATHAARAKARVAKARVAKAPMARVSARERQYISRWLTGPLGARDMAKPSEVRPLAYIERERILNKCNVSEDGAGWLRKLTVDGICGGAVRQTQLTSAEETRVQHYLGWARCAQSQGSIRLLLPTPCHYYRRRDACRSTHIEVARSSPCTLLHSPQRVGHSHGHPHALSVAVTPLDQRSSRLQQPAPPRRFSG